MPMSASAPCALGKTEVLGREVGLGAPPASDGTRGISTSTFVDADDESKIGDGVKIDGVILSA